MIKRILNDLKFFFTLPLKLFCDNNLAIYSALDLIHHGRMKQICIWRHFIIEKFDLVIFVIYILKTKGQRADI